MDFLILNGEKIFTVHSSIFIPLARLFEAAHALFESKIQMLGVFSIQK